MRSSDEDPGQKVAVFRYGVIADVLRVPERTPERAALLRAKAELEYEIPGRGRRRIAVNTMRHWIRQYRQGGLDALRPKARSDRGRSRSIPEEAADVLKEIKEGNPQLSTRLVIREARRKGRVPAAQALPQATVHRLLARAGLTRPRTKAPPDLRRFAYEFAGELWQSDVMHGPKVGCDPNDRRKRRKACLTATLDDATRVVPYAAFHFRENTGSLLEVLRNGMVRRGVPLRLYCDNGGNYRGRLLQTFCATLDVCLIHATPYHPQGKGKIERFFRTVRQQFLADLAPRHLASLEALNRALRRWIEGEYHHAPHGGLGEGHTPLDRWAQRGERLRPVPPDLDLVRLCMPTHQRQVSNDRIVRLNGRLYEVDARLVGRGVVLFEDPDAPPERPLEVECDGEPAGQAVPLDPLANARRQSARRPRKARPEPEEKDPGPDPPDPGLPLRKLQRPGKPSPEDPEDS